jgi:hypothetical protein
MDRRINMADGGTPDAHHWSFPMAKQATTGDREPNAPTLKVVGGTPSPQPMSLSLDGDVEAHIGGRLRAMYDSVLREPVPDRFLDLLRQLDTKIDDQPANTLKRKDR